MRHSATSLRIGLIVGKGADTDRLTWWVRRIDEARSSKDRIVPAPLLRGWSVQILDVRDAAEFAVVSAEDDLGRIWDVNCEAMPMSELLEAISSISSSMGEVRWVSPDAFSAAGANPWTDVPLMAPDITAFRHFLEVDASRACDVGLKSLCLKETLQPLVIWDPSRWDMDLICGMSAEKEEKMLTES